MMKIKIDRTRERRSRRNIAMWPVCLLYVNHVIHLAPGQAQSKAAADPETWSMFPGNVEIIS